MLKRVEILFSIPHRGLVVRDTSGALFMAQDPRIDVEEPLRLFAYFEVFRMLEPEEEDCVMAFLVLQKEMAAACTRPFQ